MMSKGVNLFTTLITSLIISVIVSAGLLYVAIPIVYPSNIASSSLNYLQMERIEEQTETRITDNDLIFTKLLDTEVIFTIKDQSSILAQFVGDFESTVYFIGYWNFEIALVIKNVGNQTSFIKHTGTSDSVNQYDSHNIVINYLTQSLSAGNYTVGVYWRSIYTHASQNAYLKTYYLDQNLNQANTTRTLTLWEIANGN